MNISLSQLRIASPCTVSWDSMTGDDRSRFCGQCKLNVYNISVMTQSEAERLIAEKEGRVCVRMYQRADGTVLTRDCPIGLAAVRKRVAWTISKIAAGIVLLVGGLAWAVDYANPYRERAALSQSQPFGALSRWLNEPIPQRGQWLAGDICPPPMPTALPAPVNSGDAAANSG